MHLNRNQILVVVSLCLMGTIAFYVPGKKQYPRSRRTETPLTFEPQAWALPDPTPNDAHNYQDIVTKLEAERVALASRYRQADSSAQQADIMDQARTLVTRSI